jgi:hypothetical protein
MTTPILPATPGEWRTYLFEYGEVYIRTANEYQRPLLTPEQLETNWLGTQPATDEDIAATEQRLGVPLPPSLSAFLRASDGWEGVGGWIDEILPCAQIDWLRDTDWGDELIEIYSEDEPEDDGTNEPLDLFRRALLIARGEDIWLLDPTSVTDSGEYLAVDFTPKYGDSKEYPSFAVLFDESKDLMIRLHDS